MSLGNIRVGAILPGKIVRITDYGAFCELNIDHNDNLFGGRGKNYRPIRGLIHISQLSSTRVENVNDVVSMDDSVWVKVLDISEYDAATPNSDNNTDRYHTSHRNPRHKVSLSLKDASQDGSGRDLAEEESNEKQQRLKSSTQMESNLNSTIGMGIARDPMDPMAQRILLKQDKKKGAGALINGYSLVDDTEGEPCPPAMGDPGVSATRPSAAITDSVGSGRLAPMGRGRGATLPAWMTQPNLESEDNRAEGPVGIRSQRRRQTEGSTSDDEINRGGHHHRHRKKKKKKKHKDHKRKDKKSSSRRDRHLRHKHSKHGRRKERRKESDDWSDDNSRSSSRSTHLSRSDDGSIESGAHSKIRRDYIDSSHEQGGRLKRSRDRSSSSSRRDSRNRTGLGNDGGEDINRQAESDSKRRKSYSKNERRHHTEGGNNLHDDDQSKSSSDSREENDHKNGGAKRGKPRKRREGEDSTKDQRRRHSTRRHHRSHSDDEVSYS